jgi:hypothetical protein
MSCGWFGGEPSAEIRLPMRSIGGSSARSSTSASPIRVDLSGLRWQRGGYRVEDLDDVYTATTSAPAWCSTSSTRSLLDPQAARGLGFCVSVAHAQFMARFFNEHGVPATGSFGARVQTTSAVSTRAPGPPRDQLHLRGRPLQRGRRHPRGGHGAVPASDGEPHGLPSAARPGLRLTTTRTA